LIDGHRGLAVLVEQVLRGRQTPGGGYPEHAAEFSSHGGLE
jgi:hypothetical protein